MTKTEKRRQINERFYQYVNDKFPEYVIDHSEGYGRVYLSFSNSPYQIEYSQSEHTVCCLKSDGEKVKEDCEKMELYLRTMIIPYVEWLAA